MGVPFQIAFAWCLRVMDRKCRGGNVALKLDISKAFDTIDWAFLKAVLKSFAFNERFLLMIQVILESAKFSKQVNVTPHGSFGCSRGVRQGDPDSLLSG